MEVSDHITVLTLQLKPRHIRTLQHRVKLIPETVLFDGAGNLTSLIGFVEFLVKILSTIKTTNAPLPSLMFWQPPCEKAGPLKAGYTAGH